MEIARQLSMKGLKVLIGCRDEERGRIAIEKLSTSGVDVDLEAVDVNCRNSIDQLMKRVKIKYGRLDVLAKRCRSPKERIPPYG
ncbi:SDR family NAD(P)-dependent oxidoreductase [Paenibacillus thailandensis]|uniref:SDR family NAD(P)-dependent oxidoreductase n=1 Tax=Paenibacillus thailandensis TaxID=393250 RepID=A0ABW5R6Z5_9BACL